MLLREAYANRRDSLDDAELDAALKVTELYSKELNHIAKKLAKQIIDDLKDTTSICTAEHAEAVLERGIVRWYTTPNDTGLPLLSDVFTTGHDYACNEISYTVTKLVREVYTDVERIMVEYDSYGIQGVIIFK